MFPLNNILVGLCILSDDEYQDHEAFIKVISKNGIAMWHPIILANPNVSTGASIEFYKNYQYLNSRTGNIRFYVPGLIKKGRASENSTPLPAIYGLDKYNFESEKFVQTLEWLESSCKGYSYSEGADLILLHSNPNGTDTESMLEYDKFIYVNLDRISTNVNSFIQGLKRKLEDSPSRADLVEYLNVGSIQSNMFAIKDFAVFIAGSKDLFHERNVVRSQLQQISNRTKIAFSSYTYEDFSRAFVENGQQAEYNKFIANQADFVIFIIDGKIGGITFDEFNVAMSSFMESRRPRIFTYCKDIDAEYPEIQHIMNKINEHHQYYCEYRDIFQLESSIRQDFMDVAWDLKR